MKLIIEKDYEAMSQTAATLTLARMYQNRRVNISITAGSTPKRVYEIMAPQVKDKSYLDNVYYYNFDEIPVKGEEFGITMRDLTTMYFTPAAISRERIVPLNEQTYTTQMERIRSVGGLDFMLLGLGFDGHYCGNLPGATHFEDEIVTVSSYATPDMEKRLIKNLDRPEQLFDFYLTMGPKAVMETKELVIIANGTRKAPAVKEFLTGTIRNEFPASVLKLHPNLTLILDEEAASLL